MDNQYEKFDEEVKEGKIRRAYLLLGENDFLKEQLVKGIKDKIIKPGFENTDRLLIYGKEVSADTISWLQSSPFGSKKKLLVIKDAEGLLKKIKKAIQSWLDGSSESSVLVLMSKKNGFKNIASCTYKKLYSDKMFKWLKSFVRGKGFDIEAKAMALLQGVFGTELRSLSTEIEKLMSFIEPRKIITLKDVEEIESYEFMGSIFDLTDAIGERNVVKAEQSLELLFDLGEKPGKILWMIYWHLEKLLKLKENPFGLPGVNRFFLQKYKNQARLWEKQKIFTGFSSLFEADFMIKTGKAKSDFALREVIYKLC